MKKKNQQKKTNSNIHFMSDLYVTVLPKKKKNSGIQRKDSKTLSVIVGRMLLELALVVIFVFFPPTAFTVVTTSLAIINLSW